MSHVCEFRHHGLDAFKLSVSKKAFLREGALTMFPFKKAFKRENGKHVRAVIGNNNKREAVISAILMRFFLGTLNKERLSDPLTKP